MSRLTQNPSKCLPSLAIRPFDGTGPDPLAEWCRDRETRLVTSDRTASFDDYYRPRRELGPREQAILAEPRIAVVATVSPSGDPLMAPCWYLYDDGVFQATVHTDAQRARNIVRTGRARIMVEHPLGYVSAVGDAEIVTGGDIRAIHDQISARYLTESGRRDFLDAGVPDDAVIRIVPTRWTISDMTQTSVPALLRDHTIDEVTGWFGPISPRDP